MILYINACVRENSRTDRLAKTLLAKLGEYTEINLEEEDLKPLTRETLETRTKLIEKGDFDDPMFRYAKQFAAANYIVIGAPYWDMGFPASLKVYLENIYVTNLVSTYDESGIPKGLCNGKMLYYVTTAGGPFAANYSYDYIRDLTTTMFGIKDTKLLMVEGLDLIDSDPEQLMQKAIDEVECKFCE